MMYYSSFLSVQCPSRPPLAHPSHSPPPIPSHLSPPPSPPSLPELAEPGPTLMERMVADEFRPPASPPRNVMADAVDAAFGSDDDFVSPPLPPSLDDAPAASSTALASLPPSVARKAESRSSITSYFSAAPQPVLPFPPSLPLPPAAPSSAAAASSNAAGASSTACAPSVPELRLKMRVRLCAPQLLRRVTAEDLEKGRLRSARMGSNPKQKVEPTERLTIRSLGRASSEGQRFAVVRVADSDNQNIHRQGGRTGLYWAACSLLVHDLAADADAEKKADEEMLSAPLPTPEELPPDHSVGEADAASAAAVVARGYWDCDELTLRQRVLRERVRLGCATSFERAVLSSFDIEPADAKAMMKCERDDLAAVKEELKVHAPTKVRSLPPSPFLPSPPSFPPSPPSNPSPSPLPSKVRSNSAGLTRACILFCDDNNQKRYISASSAARALCEGVSIGGRTHRHPTITANELKKYVKEYVGRTIARTGLYIKCTNQRNPRITLPPSLPPIPP